MPERSPEHAGELTGDERDLVAQAGAGLAIMQHADGDIAGEAEGEKAAAGVEREGFRAFDANERSEATELPGDIARLLVKAGGVWHRRIGMAEDAAPSQAYASTETGQAAEQFHDAGGIQIFLHTEQGAEQKLVRGRVELGEAEEGVLSLGHRDRGHRGGHLSRSRRPEQRRGDRFTDAHGGGEKRCGGQRFRLRRSSLRWRREERGHIRRNRSLDLRRHRERRWVRSGRWCVGT